MQNKNYRDNQSHKKPDNVISNICAKIESADKLANILTVANVSLPGGFAELCSRELGKIKSNQLRKFFDTAQRAAKMAEKKEKEQVELAKDILYSLVPQIAYSVGRDLCNNSFYQLVKSCISPQKLKDSDDIEAFKRFFEAILAYNKFIYR